MKTKQRKAVQLGMNPGTAAGRLRKLILFDLARQLNLVECFRCNLEICDIENFTIEHKIPWLDSEDPTKLYFDLNNITFSHMSCNYGAARKGQPDREMKNLLCTGCGDTFKKHVPDIRYAEKNYRQKDFYCSSKCAGKAKGKGYGRYKPYQ